MGAEPTEPTKPEEAAAAPAASADDSGIDEAIAKSEAQRQADRLKVQCYLMAHHTKYAAPSPGYKNITCIDGNPTDLLQKLAAKKGAAGFLNMTSDQIALLVPHIRLFRIDMDPTTKKPRGTPPKEIRFKTYYDEHTLESMTQDLFGRGDAVGLKELTYGLDTGAGSLTTALSGIEVTLKFIAESLGALAKGRSKNQASPLDLVLPSHPFVSDPSNEGGTLPNSKHFAVKLVWGWAVPTGAAAAHLGDDVLAALKKSQSSLVLSMVDHTITFKENGQVELEAKYTSWADASTAEIDKNVLIPNKMRKKRIAATKKTLADKQKATKDSKTKADAANAEVARAKKDGDITFFKDNKVGDDAQEAQATTAAKLEAAKGRERSYAAFVARLEGTDKEEKYNALISRIQDTGKLWFVEISASKIKALSEARATPAQVEKMSPENKELHKKKVSAAAEAAKEDDAEVPTAENLGEGGGHAALEKLKAVTSQAATDKVAVAAAKDKEEETDAKDKEEETLKSFDQSNTSTTPNEQGKVRINYIKWGDLLSAALDSARATEPKEFKLRYLVGPVSFWSSKLNKWHQLNLADIPISLQLFSTWWLKHVIGPGRDIYTIRDFIKHSVDELIVAALGDGCQTGRNNTITPTRVNMRILSSPAQQGGKDRIAATKRVQAGSIADMGDAITSKPENQYEYLFIYSYAWTMKDLVGNRARDEKMGIYHFAIGQERGPVKSIVFENTGDEWRETQATMDAKGISRLAASYNIKMAMMGNTLLLPGNYFFVAPTSMGLSEDQAYRLGLGGYYNVVGVSGRIDASGWTVDIDGQHAFPFVDRKQRGRAAAAVVGGGAPRGAAVASQIPSSEDPEKKT